MVARSSFSDFSENASGASGYRSLRVARAKSLHQHLAEWNGRRLSPATPTQSIHDELADEYGMRLRESAFVEGERLAVASLLNDVPTTPEAFVAWFEELKRTGPGQGDPLFPYFAERSSKAELRWFLYQEVAGEAGFDDLVALTQVKMPPQAKLELARNYWDEMGQGHASGMHGPMLARLAEELALPKDQSAVVEESLALGNLLVAFATNRRYAYHSIGALGAIELTAPGRAEYVNAALKRHGIRGEARRYFALHATLDVKHSEAWNRDVLFPLVAADPTCAKSIAEGAALRLTAGAKCFARYRRQFEGLASALGLPGEASLEGDSSLRAS